ncbi:MAG: quinolinate synthase NadA [Planctomycetaceae bacterium]|jgi:quinolinate synthase|nr:quinolinate synthase NadA [Planctomycetaceae bacterium]
MNNLHDEIDAIRQRLGKKLLILGHHYQREEIVAHTDMQGDSFQLSAAAAQNTDCETIIFCGVHFMAETADILANSPENLAKRGGRRVDVVLPDIDAGCSMAEMATRQDVEYCRNSLTTLFDDDKIIPVTYVNSTAELKAFCGQHGGFACTSTNAQAVLREALQLGTSQPGTPQQESLQKQKKSQKPCVLFFPDQHLGQNTAIKMGISESQISLWNSNEPDFGGNTPEQIKNSRIILWNGYCCVHQKFVPGHIDEIRKAFPKIRVIVHPECRRDVVEKADESGSTAFILKQITESPAGSQWAVGTESRFVERLARQNPDKTIVNLAFQPSYCETMGLIELPKLAAMLMSVESGLKRNLIRVDDHIAPDALRCLRRMLQACS